MWPTTCNQPCTSLLTPGAPVVAARVWPRNTGLNINHNGRLCSIMMIPTSEMQVQCSVGRAWNHKILMTWLLGFYFRILMIWYTLLGFSQFFLKVNLPCRRPSSFYPLPQVVQVIMVGLKRGDPKIFLFTRWWLPSVVDRGVGVNYTRREY